MTDSQHAVPEAEAWVIGALLDAEGPLLRSNTAALLEASGLTADDLTRPDMRTYLAAIRNAVDQRTPVSAQTVFGAVRGLPGVPDNALELLRQLHAMNSLRRDELLAHAARVRELALLRRLRAFYVEQLAALDGQKPDAAKLAAKAEAFAQTFVGSVQPLGTGEADVLEVMDDWDAYMQGRRTPVVPTGIAVLDEHLGGWVANLNVIGGLPGLGKTALIGECIWNHLRANVRTGLFGLEDGTKWWVERHLARQLDVRLGLVANCRLNDYQLERAQVVAGELHQLGRNLITYNRAGITPEQLIARAKRMIYVEGVRVIYVDHGGEVEHQAAGARDRHDLAVAATYRALRNLAVNAKVPIVALHHFNRDADGGRPKLKHLKESGYLDAMARVALGLWEHPSAPGRLLVEVLKVTKGPKNYTLAIERDAEHGLVKSTGGGDWSEPKPTRGNGRPEGWQE
jgi:replicative DNA helicase